MHILGVRTKTDRYQKS